MQVEKDGRAQVKQLDLHVFTLALGQRRDRHVETFQAGQQRPSQRAAVCCNGGYDRLVQGAHRGDPCPA